VSREQRGQATVEFALVLPGFVLLVLVIVQAAVVVQHQLLVVGAAREAVRAASLDPDPGAGPQAGARVLPRARVAVTRGAVGESVRVTVISVEPTDVPVVGPLVPSVTLRAEAVMRAER
jgi:hypothetical protein